MNGKTNGNIQVLGLVITHKIEIITPPNLNHYLPSGDATCNNKKTNCCPSTNTLITQLQINSEAISGDYFQKLEQPSLVAIHLVCVYACVHARVCVCACVCVCAFFLMLHVMPTLFNQGSHHKCWFGYFIIWFQNLFFQFQNGELTVMLKVLVHFELKA